MVLFVFWCPLLATKHYASLSLVHVMVFIHEYIHVWDFYGIPYFAQPGSEV